MWDGGRGKAFKKRHIIVNILIYPVEKEDNGKSKAFERQERVFPGAPGWHSG